LKPQISSFMQVASRLLTAASSTSASSPDDTEGLFRPGRLALLIELLTAHLVVSLVALVAVGGATRVMEAGLACPDWPLCYGLLLPGRQMNMQVFLEWFHRLDAFLVGLALLALAALSLIRRRDLPGWLPRNASAALLLVAGQGALGALTVLQLLSASVVTAHLTTALLLVALISASDQRLRLWRLAASQPAVATPLPWPWLALVGGAATLVLAQSVLGGLMASRWAADLCLSSGEGCLWLLRHRLGATPAALAVLALLPASVLLLPSPPRPGLRLLAGLAAVLVALQVALGVATLRLQLSQPALTVAHQLTAALLIACLAALWGRSLPVVSGTAPSHRMQPIDG
jgi:cytochrome c oxidase assembly protein subunit 15